MRRATWAAAALLQLGFWVGQWFQRRQLDAALVARLALRGAVLLAAGYVWRLGMPLNKKIWPSSYVLHTTGLVDAHAHIDKALQSARLVAPGHDQDRILGAQTKRPAAAGR